jgi:hypothetical protein
VGAEAEAPVSGSGAITLAALGASAEAEALATGTLSVTLAPLTLAAEGTVEDLPTVEGTAAITLAALSVAGSAAAPVTATAEIVLSDVELSAGDEGVGGVVEIELFRYRWVWRVAAIDGVPPENPTSAIFKRVQFATQLLVFEDSDPSDRTTYDVSEQSRRQWHLYVTAEAV